jgi:hypothetical protein
VFGIGCVKYIVVFEANDSTSPSVLATKMPVMPSTTRQVSPSIARSGSCSRVRAWSVTPSTSLECNAPRYSTC